MSTTSVRPPPAEVVGRQSTRDPDSWLLYLAAAVGILSAVQLFVYPFGRTLSEFAIGGREILLGGAPGKTYWSLRAPGISLLHAAIQGGISTTATAARAIEVSCLLGIAVLSVRISKRVVDLERVGVIGGALALFVHSQLEFEHTGQPEFFAAVAVAAATLLTLRERSRHRRFWQYAAIGTLISVAILFVPLFGLTIVPLGFWIWREERELRRGSWAPWLALLTLVGASLLGPLLLVLWLHRRAALGIFVQDWLLPQLHLWSAWSLEGFLEWIYFTAHRLVLRQSAIVPAGVLLAFALPKLAIHERRGLNLLLAIVGAELLAFALSYESNPGRLSGALPILSMIAGIGIYKLYRRMLAQGPTAVVAFASGLFLLAALCTAVDVAPGSYWYRSWVRLKYIAGLMPYRAPELLESDLYSNNQINLAASRRVAALLTRMRPADRTVLVAGDEPQVLWHAKLRPLPRLTRPLPEDLANADAELDQRMSHEVEESHPQIVVVSPSASILKQSSAARRLGFERSYLLEHYEVADARDGWALRVPKP